MRTLYHANTGDDLAEGMFDADGTLLDLWSPNDGYWSCYFNRFMRKLGHEVKPAPQWMVDKLRACAAAVWGLSDEEAGIE